MSDHIPATTGTGLAAAFGGRLPSAAQIKEAGGQFREYLGAIQEFVRETLRPGPDADYGVIPGTKKPTLLQPGADKLMGLFGLVIRYHNEQNEGPDGRFDVVSTASLYHGEMLIGEASARASSFESKWRYRFGSRKCPTCSKETIRKSKEEWGGGWYCAEKSGGCGAKFRKGDQDIEGQEVGKVQNEDIVDCFNTVLQIAQKRAKVAAVRQALRLTDLFTQDVGDPEQPDAADREDRAVSAESKPAPEPGASLSLVAFTEGLAAKGITNSTAMQRARAKYDKTLSQLTDAERGELYAEMVK